MGSWSDQKDHERTPIRCTFTCPAGFALHGCSARKGEGSYSRRLVRLDGGGVRGKRDRYLGGKGTLLGKGPYSERDFTRTGQHKPPSWFAISVQVVRDRASAPREANRLASPLSLLRLI